MRTLKVVWDQSLAARDKAGTGIYAARLLEQLGRREDVSLEILGEQKEVAPSKGWLQRNRRMLGNLVWTHTSLPSTLRKIGADIFHAPAFIAPVSSPCPTVITVHDITYLLYPSHFHRWWSIYLKAMMPLVLRSAAAVVCVSEHSKADIIAAYKLPAAKVHAIPNGVDHDSFHPGIELDRDWARSLGIREGYVLHVGAFSYRKNIPVLLRAIARLRERNQWQNRQLVLAGPQDLAMKGAHEVFETIQTLGLSESVVLTGYIPAGHMPALYAQAAMLVIPSLYEGFGLPLLESMAAGVPVIASDASSLPEVAGDAAILFPAHDDGALADAIASLLNSKSLAAELRSKGLQRAQEFSWKRAADETMAVYRSVARS